MACYITYYKVECALTEVQTGSTGSLSGISLKLYASDCSKETRAGGATSAFVVDLQHINPLEIDIAVSPLYSIRSA
jgi:hypothetical protein